MTIKSFAASLIVLLATAGAARATEVVHQNINDTTMTAGDGDAFNGRGVQVFRIYNPGQNNTQWLVVYFTNTCDNGYPVLTCDGLRGYGVVPGGAAQGNTRTGRLTVDTSTVAGYQNLTFHSVYDFSGEFPVYTETYGPATGGVLDVSFSAAVGQFQTSHSGSERSGPLGFTTTVTGSRDFTVATAQGTMLGTPLAANAFGVLGVTHTSVITVDRN